MNAPARHTVAGRVRRAWPGLPRPLPSRAFFLIASVYANPDETMNDDAYAYDTISFPALADVGEAFCRHAFASTGP